MEDEADREGVGVGDVEDVLDSDADVGLVAVEDELGGPELDVERVVHVDLAGEEPLVQLPSADEEEGEEDGSGDKEDGGADGEGENHHE